MVEFLQPLDIGSVMENTNFAYRHGAKDEVGDIVLGYSLSGDVPVGLTVDDKGYLTGRIKPFEYQPYCQDQIVEKEKPNFDGSNYTKVGRFEPDFYDFNFTITVIWEDALTLPDTEKTTSKLCVLRMRKDFGLNGEIFLAEWKKLYADRG